MFSFEGQRFSFEADSAVEEPADEAEESDDEDFAKLTPSPAEASQELADLLSDLHLKGRLAAKDVCLIAFLGSTRV